MNRRQFITTASASLLLGSCHQINKLNNNTSLSFFKSGDTIDSIVGQINIDGWNLLIGENQLEQYKIQNPKKTIIIEYLDTCLDYIPKIVIEPYKEQLNGIIYDLNKKNHVISSFPTDVPKFLIITEKNNDKIINIQGYGINLNSAITIEKGSEPLICSEISITKKDIDSIIKLNEVFKAYNKPPYIYICKSEDEYFDPIQERIILSSMSPCYDRINERIVLESREFTHPKIENDGLMSCFHEQSHALLRSIINSPDQRSIVKMWNVYETLINLRVA